ncbi:MAG TPA: sulfatase-like hydrolase/transferase [Candidatus Binataceae bacterium]|nr:sulfatase-like hydrolase/transferase [Candidatus Binataceae bacterium]
MAAEEAKPRPRNAIVVLLDSLNRHMLGGYGGREFATPNLDAFARRAIRFEKHYTGSLPCMPARHDILCGAIDFLWRPWGSIEIWEEPITAALRREGVVTKLVSDHPHLFEVGGENYHTDFDAWDYQRGHESDPWKTRPDPSWIGAPSFGRGWTAYDKSRGYFQSEENFPGPRTLSAAARWLDDEAPAHDHFMLFVDEFDPHEPFDTPEPYASMYDPRWQGPHLIWPPYVRGALKRGLLTPEQARQVRACYGAKLTMIDAWFGKLIVSIERGGFFANSAVIVCTDHGHYLGEKDIWGKPAVPVYEPLGHIPLMIAWPGFPARAVDALTTNVDICATLADLFGATMAHRTHGHSMLPLIESSTNRIREWAVSGVWGREVHLIDRQRKYARAPYGENAPLSVWSNRWSTMPVPGRPELKMPLPDDRATLDQMPGSKVPVIRQPFGASDRLPFWAMGKFDGHHLYDLANDPLEERNLTGTSSEKDATEQLRAALKEIEAPDDQLMRLGLA